MLLDLANVVAGQESAPFPGEYGASDGEIGIQEPKVLAQALPSGDGHRVELFRPVEDEPGNRAPAIDLDG
jgi:hypothetical protein